MQSVQQQGDGVRRTALVATSNVALPLLPDGSGPRIVRVGCEEDTADTGILGAFVRTGLSAVVATRDEGLYITSGSVLFLYVRGHTHIAAIRAGATGADTAITVVPVE